MDPTDKNIPTEIEVETYLNDRLVDQMNWYDNKSLDAQKRFKRLSRIEIFSAASIPFLAGFMTVPVMGLPLFQVIVGVLGVVVATISGLLALNKDQEIWVKYRTTAESLKHHLSLFQTKTSPYGGSEQQRFGRLVENVESLISQENSDWSIYIRQKAEDQKGTN